jgi:hypothetical protein
LDFVQDKSVTDDPPSFASVRAAKNGN